MLDKLIITRPADKPETYGPTVRISNKTLALLDDLAQKSGRPRSYIANKLIEFAYDRVTIAEGGTGDE